MTNNLTGIPRFNLKPANVAKPRPKPKKGDKLSERQQSILDFIRQSIQLRRFPPSLREIGEAVGLKGPSTVHVHLETIEAKGYIRRDRSKPRSIELLDGPDLEQQATALRAAMRAALDNPGTWRETLEQALAPMPAEVAA